MTESCSAGGARSSVAIGLLVIFAGLLLLAHVVIPCTAPKVARMTSKFSAMCKPPAYRVASVDTNALLGNAVPERAPAMLVVVAFVAYAARAPHVGGTLLARRVGPRPRDGDRRPFCSSDPPFLPAFAAARDH